MNRTLAAVALLVLAAQGPAQAGCRDADFSADTTTAATVRDGVPRLHFVNDDPPGCPNSSPACQSRAFVVPGDAVLVAGTQDGFACAAFAAAGGDATTGWLPQRALMPDTSAPSGWDGRWKRVEADIAITHAPGGALRVHGDATWGTGDPERVRRGGIHIGELGGTAAPTGGVLAFTVGDDRTLPYDKGDETDCRVRMVRRGPYLVVKDNLYCGGANVSFSGLYRRRAEKRVADGTQALPDVRAVPCGESRAGKRRVVVITGASSGIGRCAAGLFGRRGWDVGLIARGAAGLDSVQAELAGAGARAASAVADVADGAALERAAAALERVLGPVDVWVNCAGNGVYGAFLDVPEAEFRRVTDVTYMGTVNGTRVALRRMVPRGGGVVVNVCSAMVFGSLPALSSYAGAKHAIRGFTDSVRHELEQAGSPVRLTTVFPPAVNTPFFSHAPSYLPLPPRPAKPVYQPDVVADAILLAATARRREIEVSGITVVFAFASRMMPGVVRWAIGRLGSHRQMTNCPEAARLHMPNLAEPSSGVSGVYGPFGAEARRISMQMWASRHRAAVAGVAVAAIGLLVMAALR